MSSELFVITGATGNIGQKLAENVLAKGKKVRAIGRSAEKLQSLVKKGAEAFVGSLDDTSAMTKAFSGAKAVFSMIPPKYDAIDFRAYQNTISQSLAQAIQSSGVRYVVNLSSIGAHRADKLGPINGLYDHEQRLNKLEGVHVLHLRPAYFMENQFGSLGLIKQAGINGSAMTGDHPIPMIATRDIAEVAARHLTELTFIGKSVQELLGPRDLTLNEVTAILGKAIGKPDLKYVQFTYADMEKALLGLGFSKDVARLFNEMASGFDAGLGAPTRGRTPQTTTPTTFEDFAKILAGAYKS